MNAFIEQRAAARSYRRAALVLLTAKLRVDMRHAGKKQETAVHRAADAHLDAMTLAIRAAFNIGRKHLGNPPSAERAAAAVKKALGNVLPPVLAQCFAAGGNAQAGMLPRRMRAAALRALDDTFNISFDKLSPEAIAYAKEHAAALIDDLSDTTKQDIQDAIAAALEGDGIDAAIEDIAAAVGDDARAELIARTELMDAANQGALEAMSSAQDAGLLSANATKVWIASPDACDDCLDLDDEEVALDDDFSSGDDAPPAHPNCRCSIGVGTGDGA